jgi:hypothetical protein
VYPVGEASLAKPEAVKSPDGSSPRSVGGHGSEAGITQPPRYAVHSAEVRLDATGVLLAAADFELL